MDDLDQLASAAENTTRVPLTYSRPAPIPQYSAITQRITRVEPQSGYRLRLVFADGLEGVVDFAPTVEKGGVFSPMRDPAFFARFELQSHGRLISWPGELEFCADALWQDVHERATQSV
jgi:hypothetical protein